MTPDLPERESHPFEEMIHRFEGEHGRTQEAMTHAFGHAGWKKISHGKNARVAASPCGQYVVRISCADEGFNRYAELARSHAQNKHFPKIHAHRHLADGSLVTVMERLQPLPTELAPQRSKLMRYMAGGDAGGLSADLRNAADTITSEGDLPRDIHGDDIMFRKGDRSLVIMDPYH